jgi:serine/threonine-protein kinase
MRQCLQKQPKSRLHDIADARVAIEDAIKEPASASRPGTDRRARRSWQHAAAIGAFLIPAAAAAGWFASRVSSPPGAITHLEMSVQPADQLGNREFTSVRPSRTAIAVSPDGGVVVFSGSTNTSGGAAVVQLYTRRSGEANATPIQGTEGGRGPFFSPDGEWIGFWAANRILKVPAAGGPAVKVCDLPAGPPGLFGASWGDDGFIYFSYPVSEQEAGISRVADGGGKPTTVTRRALAKGEVHVLPHILPGGRGLLFTSRTTGDWQKAQVVLHVTDAGAQHVILDGAADARYVGPGHLVYMQLGTLMAVPFDLSTLTLTGDVVALIEGVMQAVNEPNSQGETGAGQFAVSSSGTLLYADGGTHPNSVFRMVWVDRDGGEQPVLSMRARIDRFISPRLSPDGSKIAVLQPGTTTRSLEVWIYDTERAGGQRLSSAGLQNWPVVWSPDGSRVAHGTDESGVLNIAVRDAAGVTQAMRVTKSERTQWPSSWAKGGNLLAFVQSGPANPQIWVGSMDGGSLKPQPFLDDPRFSFTHPDLSPDGKWVAYASNESGEQAVWVRPYPGPGGRFRISTENGVSPIWTSGGREILYRQTMPDGAKYYSVTVRSFSPFQRGDPRLLFQVKGQPPPYVDTGPVRGWDATADGKRFLLVRGEESRDKPVTHFHVILNWVEELKRRVPTR